MAGRRLRTISLFTGAGGLDLGIEAAGFETAVAVELDEEAVETLAHNRDWPIISGDIHSESASSERILEAAGLERGEVELLVGGPPCQPFSKSSYWHNGDSRRLDDPRASTLGEYLRVLRETLPQSFLMENVPGLAFSQKDEGLTLLRNEIKSINRSQGTNYSVNVQQLNAAEYGVPQLRNRVFVVGHRDGNLFQFPRPTHRLQPAVDMAGRRRNEAEVEMLIDPELPWATTAWDAIGAIACSETAKDLEVKGKWADLLPSIPEGSNYLYHTNRGKGLQIFGWRSRYWSMLLKLAKNRPSWTLTAQPGPAIGPFHWNNRRLCARELCALQTFPEDYEVVGTLRSAYRQVGNAVPSLLAEVLGREIQKQFFGAKIRKPLKLLPVRSAATPEPEQVQPVTDPKYLELVGNRLDHPGTGLGPGALRRESVSAG